MKQLLPSPEELVRIQHELFRRDYAEYVEYAHNGRYKHGKVSRYVCNQVQLFIEKDTGHAYDILILDLPPQHGKSMSVTETLPSWYLGKHPMDKVIQASYNDELAKMFCMRNNEKITEFGKQVFDIEIGTPNTQNQFTLTNGVGGMISAGIQGGITGRGAKLVIIDDPIKNAVEADSPTTRLKIFNEWLFSIKSRLAPSAKIILIMTRWHKDDLAGQLQATEENVTLINLPVECEQDNDVIGRRKGDALFPEIGKDNVWLADFKKSYMSTAGSRAWNALYMGKPTSEQGGIFKRSWFKYYTNTPVTPYKVISVDATFKDAETSDSVAIQVWGKIETRFYLLYRLNRIMGFTETCIEIARVANQFPDYNGILIEDKANGSAIIETLRRKFRAIIPIQPEGGKVARANAVSPLFEAENVYVRDSDYAFVDQLCDFPYADHDDDVDCCTQALNKIREVVADMPVVHDSDYRSYDDEVNNVMDFM